MKCDLSEGAYDNYSSSQAVTHLEITIIFIVWFTQLWSYQKGGKNCITKEVKK